MAYRSQLFYTSIYLLGRVSLRQLREWDKHFTLWVRMLMYVRIWLYSNLYKTRIKFKHKTFRAFTNGKCHPIIFYHLKKLLYQLYHTILQYIKHPKTLLFYHFIKILFLIFLYYFFPTVIFIFKLNNYSNDHIFNTILLKYFFKYFFIISFQQSIFFFSNSTNIPMVTFSIKLLHPANGHIFNIYRSTSCQ